DQVVPLECTGDYRDGWTSRSEHHGDELLRERKLVARNMVLRHQEPTCQALLDRMHGVTRCRLHHESEQRLRIPSEKCAEFAATIHFRIERCGRHSVADVAFGL